MKANQPNRKEGEKGAALVMALMMAALLLTGCIALLAGASLLTANVSDAVADQKAYNAAESGIQTAINVLRRNTVPSPLLNSSKPATDTDNKIDFARAINLETSNDPSNPAAEARLSRWIKYDVTSPGATAPDRASLGDDSSFSVTVRDPDNPNAIIDLTTSGSIDGGGSYKDYGTPFLNSARIQYNSASTGSVKITGRQATIGLGSFTVSKQTLFPFPDNTSVGSTPFAITVEMKAPLPALIKLRGTITAGNVTSNSVGNVKITFDSPVYSLLGSVITLPAGTITPNAPNVSSGKTDLSVTVTLSLPKRLVIRSVGYGPNGARKVFEAIVRRDNFDGLVPAAVTLVGNVSGALFKPSTGGGLGSVSFSGKDILSEAIIPPIATISGGSGGGLFSGLLGSLTSSLCPECEITGKAADLSPNETPDYLKSAANLDSLINEYRETAKASDRYFTNANPPKESDFGNFNGTGITFVEGDALLSGTGGGILIVTGKLTLDRNFDFKGTVLVIGKDGVKKINGSGNGNLIGNLVVAPYKIGNTGAGFLPPKYDVTNGAASTLIYTASNVLFGSDNYNTVVISVGEK